MKTGNNSDLNLRNHKGAHNSVKTRPSIRLGQEDVADHIDRFRDYIRIQRNLSPGTITEYTRDLRLFEEATRHLCLLHEIRPTHIENFLKLLREKRGLAPGSVNRKLAVLKSFYRWMLRQGLIDHCPTEALFAAKVPERLPVYLTREEVTRLLAFTRALCNTARGKTLHAMVSLLYYTGMRASELVGLNLTDIHRDGDKQMVRIRGKGDKERVVPLHQKAYDDVQRYLAVRPNSDSAALFVSPGENRFHRQQLNERLRTVAKDLGLGKRLTPHKLRHSFASHLIQADYDISLVAELLGHASLNTTRIYAHLRMADLQRAVATLQ